MRPDDRYPRWEPVDGLPAETFSGPIDADLESLDAELDAAGAQARRMLHGRTQPTRYFATGLRERLLGEFAAGTSAPVEMGATAAALPRDSMRGPRGRAGLVEPGETWAPTPLEPRIARRAPARTALPRSRWALVAAAALTGVVAAGALGARLDWLLPSPSPDPSAPLATTPPSTAWPTTRPSAAAVLPVPSAQVTEAPDGTVAPTPGATGAATPKPTPRPTEKPDPTPTPTPKPTQKPEPTKPPVGAMEFMAKACPGGVVLDWTKPSTEVGHYHVLRKLDGDVPASYPADGTTEVETATSFSATTTDGFDASLGGGKSATYRAFAFDGADTVLAHSVSKTVTTLPRLDLGSLGIENLGPGSIAVSWSAAEVSSACFTYGKLVVSQDDPNPSYLKGSTYLAAIESAAATGTTLEGLPSGKTVWMKYELIRVTSLGKFVVGATSVIQVAFP